MSGKKLVILFFALLLSLLGFIFWIGATGGGTANAPSQQATAPATSEPSAAPGSTAEPPGSAAPPGPLKALRDKRARDELRQRILAAWAAEGSDGDDDTQAAARSGRFVPRPAADGRGIDPAYIQEIVREDLFPMAKKCYEDLLVRRPDAGGRLEMELTIAGDDQLGGIVEDAGIAKTSSLADDRMETCMRESLLTLSFPPPAHDGVVTVVYPITFSPDEPDE